MFGGLGKPVEEAGVSRPPHIQGKSLISSHGCYSLYMYGAQFEIKKTTLLLYTLLYLYTEWQSVLFKCIEVQNQLLSSFNQRC